MSNLNAFKKDSNNRNETQFKVRLRNENVKNDKMFNKSRTPSPPKVLMSTHKFYQQMSTKALSQQSVTKSCYNWPQSYENNEETDCDQKLKKLQQSGLLAKFTNFQITKSIPLATELDEDNQQNEENDVFVDDMSDDNSSIIELKKSNDFEPQFVTKIKEEVRKLSSQSFETLSSQRNSYGFSNDVKRKSNGSKSQPNLPQIHKWQQKLPLITTKPDNHILKNKSNSINNLSNNRSEKESNLRQNEVINKRKSGDQLNKNTKERRSHSSNGRLSSSTSDAQKAYEKRKQNSDLQRSQSSADIKIIDNKTNNSNNDSIHEKIKKIKVNQKYYQILNCIGKGGSSKVYQVYDQELQMTLAIKVVDLSKTDVQTVSGYKNEITLLSQLKQCKRVVRMYDYEYQNNGQQLLVVMEKGDSDLSNVLKSFIDSEARSLDPHLIRFYWQEMVKVVHEIHQYGVVHSDLKPVNFILVAGKLKLIDFGIANAIKANYTSVYKETQIGTINYMAPEALQNRSEVKGKTVIKFNCKADIWSLGCILFNLVYGKTPFHDYNNLFQKANAILDPKCEINFPPIDDLLLFDCMKKCLQRDPNKRPTTSDLLSHSYLTQSKVISNTTSIPSQTQLISQINNLTPNRMKQLSQVLEKLTKP